MLSSHVLKCYLFITHSSTEAEKRSLTLPRLTAATALKREQVGVVAVAAQAEIRPSDGVPLTRVKNELGLGELHDAGAQLVALIVHICDLGHRWKYIYVQPTTIHVSCDTQVSTSRKIQKNLRSRFGLFTLNLVRWLSLMGSLYRQLQQLPIASAGQLKPVSEADIITHCR